MLDYLEEQNQKGQPIVEEKKQTEAEEQNKVITRFLTLFKTENIISKPNPNATLSYEEVFVNLETITDQLYANTRGYYI